MVPSPSRAHPPLIKTKLCAPQRRSSLVPRPRLLNLLAEGSTRALTLICAPPGYGKTTLLTDWISSLQMNEAGQNPAICWLSLDAGDNDPTLFLNYLISALENGNPQVGSAPLASEARAMLESFPPPPSQTFLSVLINILHDLDHPICLVLDDYQFIDNRGIHEGVAYVLDHLPEMTHVIISTRSDPPLPFARLRVRNQLTEIRADALRFTADEAADFLMQVMHLPVSAENISALEARTEGWIAGLQMAAVAMHGLARQGAFASPGASAPDPLDFSQFIQTFSGSHRYILDYLAGETLNHLPADVQRFLSWTSLLDRFCAPLCDALLADPTISSPAIPSRDMLAHLDKANLFLVALDADTNEVGAAGITGDPCWYRYHHLFADLLRARLRQSQPEWIPQLHLRASAWYEQYGSVVEAIQHSLSARAYERAADLIERYGPARWSQSDTNIMLLAGQLPQDVLQTHPKLGIYQAWILIANGRSPAAVPLLHSLKEPIDSKEPPPSAGWMRACIELLLAYLSNPADGSPPMPLPDPQALNGMPEEDTGLHNIADFLYARLLSRRGELDQPAELLIHSVQRDAAARGTTAIPLAVPFLARIRLMQGRLNEAANLCREYLRPIMKRGTRFFYVAGSLNIILGEALLEWNQLAEAEAQIQAGIQANEPWHNIASDAYGYAALARVQQASGNLDGALATLQKLDAMFEERTKPPDWEGELRSLRVRLWLASGDQASAVAWANQIPIKATRDPRQEIDLLTVARVRLAERNYAEAHHILETLDQFPGIEKRINRKIKISLLLACALAGQNRIPQAIQILETYLNLAEPEGLIRVFVDAGKPMQELLKLYLRTQAPSHKPYALKLLDEFPRPSQEPSPAKTQPILGESLTPREIEVLGLMGTGLSNRQIAENLVLSEGTVKFHVHSILEKLQVHSRTAALVRAKELNLI